MPSSVFQRFSDLEPTDVSAPKFRMGGHRNVANSGVMGLRNITAKGVRWTETYPPINVGDADGEEFMSWIDWAWSNNITFTITHPVARGSGQAPLGSGTGGVTVTGVNSGDTVVVSAGTYEPGDWVRIAGYGFAMKITETQTGTLKIVPPIIVPTVGGEAVTTTGVTFSCIIETLNIARISAQSLPFHYQEYTLGFLEVPN